MARAPFENSIPNQRKRPPPVIPLATEKPTRVFLDHAATSPCDPDVVARMADLALRPLNASSVHEAGQEARKLLEEARRSMALVIDGATDDLVFTSGASEANNLAIRGLCDAIWSAHRRPLRVAASAIEHSCIRQTLRTLERLGRAEVTWLPVGGDGRVQFPAGSLRSADLLCMMAVQNETGVIQPLDMAKGLLAGGVRWLCDASQALGKIPLRLRALGATFVTVSSHKVGGPAGVGMLAGPGVAELMAQITGGPQEHEKRAGTQPVASIAGFALAASRAVARRAERQSHVEKLEEVFLAELRRSGVAFQRNGEATRAPGFLNISIEGFDAPDLVIALDRRGFCVSAGSACSTGVMEVSEALAAMFPSSPERARGALRITPALSTSVDDMKRLGVELSALVRRGALAPKRPSSSGQWERITEG